MVPPRAATELIGGIDEARAGLIAFLRSKDAQALAERPPSGEWSVIENVRHLLFAEQLHVGKFLNRVGLSGRTGKRYAEAGKDATDDLEEVLQAWDTVHRPIRGAVRGGDEEVQKKLRLNLKHLVRHIDTIKTLLAEAGG